jgi:hypothetical protein
MVLSCQNSTNKIISESEIERCFDKLASNKAVAIFQIGDEAFYTEEMQPFGIRIDVSFASLRGNLMSENGDKLLFDFARTEWYTQQPVEFKLVSSSSGFSKDYGKLMIGKQLATESQKLAGYNFVDGIFRVIEFSEEKFVAVTEGQVVKSGDADIPENMKPIAGYIIAKKPPMTFDNIKKERIFYQ